MNFVKVCTIDAPIEQLWSFLADVAAVSGCMPGIEEFRALGADEYEGIVRISVGPISLRLQGRVAVLERDQEKWTARMHAKAKESRVTGEVKADFTSRLTRKDIALTELQITAEARVFGKLGEFGQPIMKKTADRYLTQFADNVARALGAVVRVD